MLEAAAQDLDRRHSTLDGEKFLNSSATAFLTIMPWVLITQTQNNHYWNLGSFSQRKWTFDPFRYIYFFVAGVSSLEIESLQVVWKRLSVGFRKTKAEHSPSWVRVTMTNTPWFTCIKIPNKLDGGMTPRNMKTPTFDNLLETLKKVQLTCAASLFHHFTVTHLSNHVGWLKNGQGRSTLKSFNKPHPWLFPLIYLLIQPCKNMEHVVYSQIINF